MGVKDDEVKKKEEPGRGRRAINKFCRVPTKRFTGRRIRSQLLSRGEEGQPLMEGQQQSKELTG